MGDPSTCRYNSWVDVMSSGLVELCIAELYQHTGSAAIKNPNTIKECRQVAQWATIPHQGASIMFGDTKFTMLKGR